MGVTADSSVSSPQRVQDRRDTVQWWLDWESFLGQWCHLQATANRAINTLHIFFLPTENHPCLCTLRKKYTELATIPSLSMFFFFIAFISKELSAVWKKRCNSRQNWGFPSHILHCKTLSNAYFHSFRPINRSVFIWGGSLVLWGQRRLELKVSVLFCT